MNLYLYKIGENIPELTIENVTSYTEDSAVTEDGQIYSQFDQDCEFSSRPDCSETLRADWRRDHPEDGDRLGAIEREIAAIAAAIERGMSL